MGNNLLLLVFLLAAAVATAKLILSNVKQCYPNNNHQYIMQQALNRERNGIYEYDWTLDLKQDLGNDNKHYTTVEKITKGKAKHLITIKGKGGCTALSKYGGEIYVDIARKMKNPHPEKCPIQKNLYHLSWYPLNLESVPIIAMLPKGELKLTIKLFDLDEKVELTCVEVTVNKS